MSIAAGRRIQAAWHASSRADRSAVTYPSKVIAFGREPPRVVPAGGGPGDVNRGAIAPTPARSTAFRRTQFSDVRPHQRRAREATARGNRSGQYPRSGCPYPHPMGAVQITRFGGPGVMDVVDLPDPTPGDGEQLFDVSAAGV